MCPRAFDSDEVDRAHLQVLRFTENVECPTCAVVFEGDFYDWSMSVQDIVEPPIGEHTCPGCQQHWVSAMSGWTMYSDGT